MCSETGSLGDSTGAHSPRSDGRSTVIGQPPAYHHGASAIRAAALSTAAPSAAVVVAVTVLAAAGCRQPPVEQWRAASHPQVSLTAAQVDDAPLDGASLPAGRTVSWSGRLTLSPDVVGRLDGGIHDRFMVTVYLFTPAGDRVDVGITPAGKCGGGRSTADGADGAGVPLVGTLRMPDEPGRYVLQASMFDVGGTVQSETPGRAILLDGFEITVIPAAK